MLVAVVRERGAGSGTFVGALGAVGFVAADVEDYALQGSAVVNAVLGFANGLRRD